ncbi:hypothetical protein [Kribbella albertanoniae]|uniref:Secreted protein n=1 Tax=Kribbella albertanoniae TaxID=1266829 RepID=A0A4R4PH15_9ACTN|nr:hypothetical protein [Kribbella albertanoniae]TDC21104.1 hypothetical protein E1261_34105 [Kribbella albertanoniae]
MKVRMLGTALGVVALAGVPVAAQAAPVQAQTTQPYQHLVTVDSNGWSTGGTYVATGGDIKLKLTTLEKSTKVFVERCEGADLGDVQTFTKAKPSHTLATGVEKGECFIVLLSPATGKGGYFVKGSLAY